MFDYIDYLKKYSGNFGSCPFWSWNDKLRKEVLLRQIADMKRLGMRGFFMHARSGLKTGYFSEEWFDCVRACVSYAKENDMQAWLYDENGWPSGFADRRLLDDRSNLCSYLKMSETEAYPEELADGPYTDGVIAVYDVSGGIPRRVNAPSENGKYICISRFLEPSYVDTLNIKVTEKFIELIYDEYYKRFSDILGSENMPGFFTDEPQYFRYATPWSAVLPEEFEREYGYSVFDVLPALFTDYEGACEKRYDYWRLLHKLFINNWIKPVYEWCDSHGCIITGHAIEESSLYTQMWCCGGVMPFYEYEHIPGVDHLGRGIDAGLEAKQVGSVSAQLGKKRTLSEIFACTGFDVTLKELKRIGDSMYVEGVNLLCQHLYAYSSRGVRKYDYPMFISEQLEYKDALKKFNLYFDRLGCLLSSGNDMTDVLVIHPMQSAYLFYRREADAQSVMQLESAFKSQLKQLWQAHILFHLGDEELMEKYAGVEGDSLRVGKCVYHTVILPDMYTISNHTKKLLEEFVSGGGKLLCMGRTPEYTDGRKNSAAFSSNVTLDEIKVNCGVKLDYQGEEADMLKYTLRKSRSGYVMFVTNLSNTVMRNIAVCGLENPVCIDLTRLKYSSPDITEGTVFLTLKPGDSAVLAEGADTENAENGKDIKSVTELEGEYTVTQPPENLLVLDYARYSLADSGYSSIMPVVGIRQELLNARYEGRVSLKFEFEANVIPDNLRIDTEPQKNACLSVNGREIPSYKSGDGTHFCYYISDATKIGENTIIFSFDYYQSQYIYDIYFGNGTESLKNCLSFDTEVENIYLCGNFSVKTDNKAFTGEDGGVLCYTGGFTVDRQCGKIPALSFTRNGYPFFRGAVRLSRQLKVDAQNAAIRITGRFTACEVYLNGEYAGDCFFNDTVDISRFILPGDNLLELNVYSTDRNMYGPFHYIEAEPISVSPAQFLFENERKDGGCKEFCDRYAFVNFGIKVELIEYEIK